MMPRSSLFRPFALGSWIRITRLCLHFPYHREIVDWVVKGHNSRKGLLYFSNNYCNSYNPITTTVFIYYCANLRYWRRCWITLDKNYGIKVNTLWYRMQPFPYLLQIKQVAAVPSRDLPFFANIIRDWAY